MPLTLRSSALHRAARRRLIGCAGLILCLILPLPALSQNSPINLGLYQDLRESVQRRGRNEMVALKVILDGLIDGMRAMNVAYVSRGASPQLCVPADLDTVGLTVAIDDLLLRYPGLRDNPNFELGLIAKIAITKKFPCP